MAKKILKGKPKLGLLFGDSLSDIAFVREFGNDRYGPTDWKEVEGIEYIHASLRHIYKHLGGELLDSESNQSHLAHAMASLMLANEIIFHNK